MTSIYIYSIINTICKAYNKFQMNLKNKKAAVILSPYLSSSNKKCDIKNHLQIWIPSSTAKTILTDFKEGPLSIALNVNNFLFFFHFVLIQFMVKDTRMVKFGGEVQLLPNDCRNHSFLYLLIDWLCHSHIHSQTDWQIF